MFDLAIDDVRIVDGSGGAPYRGSLGVAGDRIAAIAPPDADLEARARIAGGGAALAPGFVDVHNHSDLSPFVLPTMPSTVGQGTTTVVVGNCGSTPWPLAGWDEALGLAYAAPGSLPRPAWRSWGDYLDAIDAARPSANVATLVGHGTIRAEVLGGERRSPTPAETARMRTLAADAVREGAIGLSTGLIYVPGMYATTEEIVALAEAAGEAGGLYASHIRGEGRDLFSALDEAIAVGRRAGVPAHVSHLKCESSLVWGRAADALARLHGGDDVTADQYPYAAWNSSLASLLPPWAPVRDLATVAGDGAARERLRAAVERGEADFQSSVDGVGWDAIVVEGTKDERRRGRSIAAIAEALGTDPFDAMVRLLLEDPETSCIGHAMHEDDVLAILADPAVFVASDGSATAPDGPGGDLPVHPRSYGTFPRALALARDHGLLPLEAVVRKMTALPAERFGLRGRGRIAEGAYADLVLFSAEEIRDRATFEVPHGFPAGIEAVVVNGVVTVGPGATGRAGRALRRGD
ncbi:MAG: N-acyl-D-amino-acid deacylase family protein [Planctomycetaceae bacterium]